MEELEERAERLEALWPVIARMLFRPADDDPLSELPVAQLRVIRVLALGSRTLSELAGELNLSMSAATQIANRLEEAGLVEKVGDSHDRRIRHLSLSERGTALMDARRQGRVDRVKQVFGRIPEARQIAILTEFDILLEACRQVLPPKSDSVAMVAELEQALPLPPEARMLSANEGNQ